MGKYSAVEESLSIKMKNNILKSPKHIRNLWSTYFLMTVERVSSTSNPAMVGGMKYMSETIPRTFPNINLLLTVAN
jgi:hypothetical protein